MPAFNAQVHLERARTLISGATTSLEFVLEGQSDASLATRFGQQVPFMIGELEHAIVQIKRASTVFEAFAAIARCEAAEAAEAERARAA